MNKLIKKIHMYLGLLNLSILLVFGIAGLTATLRSEPSRRSDEEPKVRLVAFTPAPGLTDKEAADQVYEFLNLPLTSPAPSYAIRRDQENNLRIDFYTVNGPRRVTVLEKVGQLRIAMERETFWNYLDNLHATTVGEPHNDIRLKLWQYYNEFAIWSLIAIALSGTYLGLTSRARYRPAQYTLAAGCMVFLVLYVLMRS